MTRKGSENSEIRTQLVAAARQLIEESGFASVTARRLAEQVGLKRQIVHYYFGTLDDLLIAVLQQEGEAARTRLKKALASDQPLKVSWRETHDASARVLEYMSLALHRDSIRAEFRHQADEFRALQTQAITEHLERRGISPETPAAASALMMASISQTIAIERALGISSGHAETIRYIESVLDSFENNGESFTSGIR